MDAVHLVNPSHSTFGHLMAAVIGEKYPHTSDLVAVLNDRAYIIMCHNAINKLSSCHNSSWHCWNFQCAPIVSTVCTIVPYRTVQRPVAGVLFNLSTSSCAIISGRSIFNIPWFNRPLVNFVLSCIDRFVTKLWLLFLDTKGAMAPL